MRPSAAPAPRPPAPRSRGGSCRGTARGRRASSPLPHAPPGEWGERGEGLKIMVIKNAQSLGKKRQNRKTQSLLPGRGLSPPPQSCGPAAAARSRRAGSRHRPRCSAAKAAAAGSAQLSAGAAPRARRSLPLYLPPYFPPFFPSFPPSLSLSQSAKAGNTARRCGLSLRPREELGRALRRRWEAAALPRALGWRWEAAAAGTRLEGQKRFAQRGNRLPPRAAGGAQERRRRNETAAVRTRLCRAAVRCPSASLQKPLPRSAAHLLPEQSDPLERTEDDAS